MARGNSTRRNLSPEEISELLKGNPAALQKQAQKGGNVQPAAQPAPPASAPAPTAQNPAGPPPSAPFPAPTPAATPTAQQPASPATPTTTPTQPVAPTTTPTPTTTPSTTPSTTPAGKPGKGGKPPPLPKPKGPWWEQKNSGALLKAIMGGRGRGGNIFEAATDFGASQEMQELINKTRKKLGLRRGQALPLPQGASIPPGVSITGGK